MTKKEAKNLLYYIEDEGFDYAIRYKSSWKEIKDSKFHELRQKYIEFMQELQKYIENET